MVMNDPDILTIDGVAKMLAVSVKTIRRNVKTLPHTRVGRAYRFSRDAIVQTMQERPGYLASPVERAAVLRPAPHPKVRF
jgi:excisionase family DNA binding protein